jgi:UDP-2-acetamido-2-deoxy-ribo-hexuluronate aminotransferase
MAGATSVWAQYTVVTDDRDSLAKACREAGVPTAIHYSHALNGLPPYREVLAPPTGLRQAEWLAERVISLPMHPYLSDEAQDLIIATVRQALSSRKTGVAHAAE